MSCDTIFERLMAEVTVRVPGAIDSAIRGELYDTLDEFFRNTHVWQEDIPLGVITTKLIYDLDSNEWVATINQLLSVNTVNQVPIAATMTEPGTLVLTYAPSTDEVYTVKVGLSVADVMDTNGFPQIPQWIAIKYREAFKDGVIGRLMCQPAKPYYNEKWAAYHGARFRSAMVSAYADAKQQNVFGAANWRFPQTFAVRRR